MPTDRITELLWNYLKVPSQLEGLSQAAHEAGKARNQTEDEEPQQGEQPDAPAPELSEPVEVEAAAKSNFIEYVVPPNWWLYRFGGPHTPETEAFLQDAASFLNAAQAAETEFEPPPVTRGSSSPPSPAPALASVVSPVSMAQNDLAVGSEPALEPIGSAETEPEPLVLADTAPVEATPIADAPAAELSVDDFDWIENGDAALAFYQASLVDGGFLGLLEAARAQLDAIGDAEGHVRATVVRQFNILHDTDDVRQVLQLEQSVTREWPPTPVDLDPDERHPRPDETGQTASAGSNTLDNAIKAETGGGGEDVLVVTGDFHQYNIIIQINITFDNDTLAQYLRATLDDAAHGGGHGWAEQDAATGGNVQDNSAMIVEGPGLPVLVGGAHFESLLVMQYSFLSDNDLIVNGGEFFGTGWDTDLGQNGSAGGNQQQNVFGMIDSGADGAWSLAEIGAFELRALTGYGSLDELVAAAANGQGATLVDGDYHEFNVMLQVNVLYDSDTIDQDAIIDAAGRRTGSVQEATAGGNDTGNSVFLMDGGHGGVVVVAGDYYEHTTVIQANFLQDDDRIFAEVAVDAAQEVAEEFEEQYVQGAGDMLSSLSG